jgi:hypothetical protein
MAAAAAMCFPADAHAASAAPVAHAAAASPEHAVAHRHAELGVISPLSFDEAPTQSVNSLALLQSKRDFTSINCL